MEPKECHNQELPIDPQVHRVIVVLREDGEPFELIPEEEAERLESIAVIERGELVSGEQFGE